MTEFSAILTYCFHLFLFLLLLGSGVIFALVVTLGFLEAV